MIVYMELLNTLFYFCQVVLFRFNFIQNSINYSFKLRLLEFSVLIYIAVSVDTIKFNTHDFGFYNIEARVANFTTVLMRWRLNHRVVCHSAVQ